MGSLVEHRGPDGHGEWVVSAADSAGGTIWVGLAHTRLSIVDLSTSSAQPFVSHCGRYVLTFNGEIYNFREIRTELEALGNVFRTNGDTEVLLLALASWGIDALRKLRGMFAFVFVDTKEQTVLVARDEYGIKPLYRHQGKDGIYFASEIKQFDAVRRGKPKLNAEASAQFLLYGLTDHHRATHFVDVEHVMPGECIEIKVGERLVEQRRSWRDEVTPPFGGSYREACQIYRDLFIESIDLHLRADVEIGSCLSGGLDSSAIVGMVAKRHFGRSNEQHTFTATSEDKRIDESRFAIAVNGFTGSTGHFIEPSAERLWEDLGAMAWHQDEPFGSTSIYAQWCVFREAAANQIKVMLDGQGADEQLGGYNSFVTTHLNDLLRRGRLLRFSKDFRAFNRSGRVSTHSLLKHLAYSIFNEDQVRRLGRLGGVASQNHLGWVRTDLLENEKINDPFRATNRVPRTVGELSREMVFRSNLPMLLRFEDRNSMAHGIEARVPFVDGPLMRFALGLPAEFLVGAGLTKTILRDSLEDVLPSEVRLRRDKIGFQTAEAKWFSRNSDDVMGVVRKAVDRLPTVFTPNTVTKVQSILDGSEPFNNIPWRVVSTVAWADAHGVED
jgi:asparagine synthase (glutamine-hydrolysing)